MKEPVFSKWMSGTPQAMQGSFVELRKDMVFMDIETRGHQNH